jgi:hypothetical protein
MWFGRQGVTGSGNKFPDLPAYEYLAAEQPHHGLDQSARAILLEDESMHPGGERVSNMDGAVVRGEGKNLQSGICPA